MPLVAELPPFPPPRLIWHFLSSPSPPSASKPGVRSFFLAPLFVTVMALSDPSVRTRCFSLLSCFLILALCFFFDLLVRYHLTRGAPACLRRVAGCRCRLAFCRCACHPGGRRLRVAASRCLRGLCRCACRTGGRRLRGQRVARQVPAVLGALAADAARAACAACAACTAWPLSAFAGLAGLWAFVSAACVVFRAVRFPDGPVDAFAAPHSLPASGRFAGWPIARLAGAISTAAGAMER
ncbi:hypothetical protein PAPYR_11685 [Paratrimastix pyriformis]|uniref:Uncharacterized protein n=1 Tax=Paratrimastix pyriformis TaxID=342808 RepID=A0ABQ8U701_9EUKA|nr:hypothetical protein PAPYR_11685 [Paratrimastix pyriformis]